MKNILLFIFMIGINLSHSAAQVIEESIENSAEVLNESNQTEIPDELADLIQHPLDLNSSEFEVLIRYNLLSAQQAVNLTQYLKKYGALIEPEELQQVDGFDKKTILNILPYCMVRSEKVTPSSQQITLRFQRSPKESDEYYNGSNAKILLRYKSVVSSSLNLALTAEKDPGEEIFTKEKPGFDFYSFNACYKSKSFIRKIIAGDYNLEFGQGLTAWTGFGFGSGTTITGIYKCGRGLVPYSGTDENRFQRGVAVSLEKGKYIVDLWASYHGIDGTKFTDTVTGDEYVSSLQTAGYHRTFSETSNYHSQHETALGGAVNYSSGNFRLGAVISYIHYSLPMIKSADAYKRYSFAGQNNLTVGFNYSYTYKNIFFFGETSSADNKSFAMLNGFLISIDPRLSAGILWRSYEKEFTALKSNAYGANTNNSNEKGTYFGLNFKIYRPLTYSTYVDVFSFPFLKYRVDKPSYGYDFFHQIDFAPTKKFSVQFRYRKRLKQQNDESIETGLSPLADLNFQSFRLSSRFKIDDRWDYAVRFEMSTEDRNNNITGKGTMISQDLFYHPGKGYSLNIRYSIFNCPEFDTRIYAYENDVSGAFSIPFYYGSGSRFYCNINLRAMNNLNLSMRYSISWLDENPSDENVKNKTEIKVQAKLTLR